MIGPRGGAGRGRQDHDRQTLHLLRPQRLPGPGHVLRDAPERRQELRGVRGHVDPRLARGLHRISISTMIIVVVISSTIISI